MNEGPSLARASAGRRRGRGRCRGRWWVDWRPARCGEEWERVGVARGTVLRDSPVEKLWENRDEVETVWLR
jgi:hypothetical protein